MAANGREVQESATSSQVADPLRLPQWTLADFMGKYHLKSIDTKKILPIPGHQLSVERERAHQQRERKRRPERLLEALQRRSLRSMKQAEQLRQELDDVRSNYGWRSGIRMNSALTEEIESATAAFANREEPSATTISQLTGPQRQLTANVLRQNYREVHMQILAAAGEGKPLNCNFPVGSADTPLILAIRRGDIKMVKILLKEGSADPNFPNAMGVPPILYIFEEWREQRINKIPGRDSLQVMLKRAADIILMLGEAGVNVNAKGLGGETPVHVAAGFGHATALFLMLKMGFDETIKDNQGKTALDTARSQQKVECVILLSEWPKVRRTAALDLFKDAWKPFLRNSDRSMDRSVPLKVIQEDLDLKERKRQNDRMARKNLFGTTVKFVYDDDYALEHMGAGDSTKIQNTEIDNAAMRAALATAEQKTSEYDTQKEQRRIAREQLLKARPGRRKNRKKKQKLLEIRRKRSQPKLTALQARRKRSVHNLIDGWRDPDEPLKMDVVHVPVVGKPLKKKQKALPRSKSPNLPPIIA